MSDSHSTDRLELPDEKGHMSATFYIRENTAFRAVASDGRVTLYIDNYGGAFSISVSHASWRAIADAVQSVLSAAEVATEAVQ